MHISDFVSNIQEHLGDYIEDIKHAYDEFTIIIQPDKIKRICDTLKASPFDFNVLIDICGVDYLHYGLYDYETEEATNQGFARGIQPQSEKNRNLDIPNRFAVVYHLLSHTHNFRIRLKAYLEQNEPNINSVVDIYPAANWFEREVFDLFGIGFKGHPDLRRILTDEGFQDYPFRKDFPLSGKTEIRYDAKEAKIVYEPVDIDDRAFTPKVFRDDARYLHPGQDNE